MQTYARYTLTVTYGIGGGTYQQGESVAIAASALYDLAFDHWTTSNGGAFGDANSANTTFTMPANATTVTAVFLPIHTVTFARQDGSPVPSQTIVHNGLVTRPADPTRNGYAFGGWFKEEALTNVWDFDTDTVTADTKLWAKWTLETYTVTYDLAGGAVADPQNPTSYTVWSIITLKKPTRAGYNFDGWTGTGLSGVTYNVSFPAGATGDRSYTAHWSVIHYEITCLNTYPLAPNPTSYTMFDDDITLLRPTKEGYAFTGWTGTGLSGPTLDVTIPAGSTGPRTYTAQWTLITYTITYQDGGYLAIPNPTSYTFQSSDITLGRPYKVGYIFNGWTGTGLSAPTISVTIPRNSTGDRVYTGNWTPIIYDISYNLYGGTAHPSSPTSYTRESGIVTLQRPTKLGYDFTGWTGEAGSGVYSLTLDPTFDAGDTYGDKSFNAHWNVIWYSISYDLADGWLPYSHPASYNVTSNVIIRQPTRVGYRFDGWTGTGLSGMTLNITIPPGSTGARSYVAHWSPEVYSISYDLDGGTMNAQNPLSYTIEDPSITIQEPIRTGYTFVGWTGTGLESITLKIIIPAGSIGERSFVANWEHSWYTVTFDSKGGSAVAPESVQYNYMITAPTPPTRMGYTFAGWYKQAAYTNAWNFATDKVTADITLYARWTANTYIVAFNSQGGTTVASKTALYNTTISAPASPTRAGYTFGGWYKQAACTTAWNFTTDNITAKTTLYAKWNPIKYAITAAANSTTYGTVSGGGSIAYGTSATVKAMPKAGYQFVRWLEGSTVVSTSASYTFTVTKARTMLAEFAPLPYTITLSANNATYGTVSGGGSITYGASTTVKATPKMGYRFVRWLEGSTAVSTSASYTFTVSKARTLKAEFAPISYAVTLSANNAAYGTVSGGGSIAYGLPTTVKATPKAGYRFVRWLEGSTTVSTSYLYGFAVTKARTLKAEFATIGTPAVTAASAGYNSIKLTWPAVAGAQGYEISRYDPIAKQYKVLATVTNTSYANTGLTTDTTYTYKVRVKCVAGSTTTYGSYSPVASAKPLLAAPTNVAAVRASSSSLKVSWYTIAGANGYEVYRATASSGKYTLMKAVTTLNWTNTGLTAGKIYYYKLKAYRVVNGTKVYSPYSAIVSAKP